MPQTTNTSLSHEHKQLLAIFKTHFSEHLNLARVRLACYFIMALCKVKSVNYSKLSTGFDGLANTSSHYRRIQRFMAEVNFPMELVAKLIFSMLPNKEKIVLVIDRTNWKFGNKNINILMLGISYKGIAFPLMFKMLNKRGNSSTIERIELICDFINWFGKDCIDCLLTDREFVGEHWLGFLHLNKINYHIRIRNNFKIDSANKKGTKASNLLRNMKPDEIRHYTKRVKMHGVYCYLSGMTYLRDGKQDFLIIVSYSKPESSLDYYKKRWQIETLFKGLKSSGFNIEDTHVTEIERLEKLIRLTMIAFTWCYRIGDHIDTQIKPIIIKKHGRRAVSVFKHGLNYLSRVLLTGYNQFDINLLRLLSCT